MNSILVTKFEAVRWPDSSILMKVNGPHIVSVIICTRIELWLQLLKKEMSIRVQFRFSCSFSGCPVFKFGVSTWPQPGLKDHTTSLRDCCFPYSNTLVLKHVVICFMGKSHSNWSQEKYIYCDASLFLLVSKDRNHKKVHYGLLELASNM